jgi:hypothetical protein
MAIIIIINYTPAITAQALAPAAKKSCIGRKQRGLAKVIRWDFIGGRSTSTSSLRSPLNSAAYLLLKE